MKLHSLFYVFSDNCTYSCDQLLGTFANEDDALTAQLEDMDEFPDREESGYFIQVHTLGERFT